MLLAAIAAGATMDMTYHPGVWGSGKYTCCDAVNNRAVGCKHTTFGAPAAKTFVNAKDSLELVQLPRHRILPQPVASPKRNVASPKRKTFDFEAPFGKDMIYMLH